MGAVAQRAKSSEFVDELNIAVDLLQHRIDDQRLAASPTGDEVGVRARDAVEELAEDHHRDPGNSEPANPVGSAPHSINLLWPGKKGRARTAAAAALKVPVLKPSRSADRPAIPTPTMTRRKAPAAACPARRARTRGLR